MNFFFYNNIIRETYNDSYTICVICFYLIILYIIIDRINYYNMSTIRVRETNSKNTRTLLAISLRQTYIL